MSIALAVFLGFMGVLTFIGAFAWMCTGGRLNVIKECSWCGKAIELGTPRQYVDQGGLSHGICPDCDREFRARLAAREVA